jgi:TfoX/Sxy family transcriptional regulator of competence genes
MAINEVLADKVRAAFANTRRVEEKKMFGSIAFMVDGKMCITVGHNRIMCRIDPELHEAATQRKGVRTVTMRAREYKGYVYVDADALRSKREIEYWVRLALDFNKRAQSSRRHKNK